MMLFKIPESIWSAFDVWIINYIGAHLCSFRQALEAWKIW